MNYMVVYAILKDVEMIKMIIIMYKKKQNAVIIQFVKKINKMEK
jgi:hypothetical protein